MLNSPLFPSAPILLVDDEVRFLESISFILARDGFTNVRTISDSNRVLPFMADTPVSVAVLDMNMPGRPGDVLLEYISEHYPDIPVIMLTADQTVKKAVQCMKSGAFDYLLKPIDEDTLPSVLRRALQFWEVRCENRQLKKYFLSDEIDHPEAFAAIITQDRRLHNIFQYIEATAASPLPVLITGETGVGKELVAQAIHRLSHRRGPFVTVNAAGIDDTLFTDTLFGHTRGSFTGAERERKGLLEQAAGGTVFLDEIGDLGPASQVKLLRLLQDNSYYALGSDQAKVSTARVVAATNHDLEQRMHLNLFRHDLYFRLQTHHIHIPPLRERREDIPLLVDHFLEMASRLFHKPRPTVPPSCSPCSAPITSPAMSASWRA